MRSVAVAQVEPAHAEFRSHSQKVCHVHSDESAGEAGAGESGRTEWDDEAVDYIMLAEMKHTLFPKIRIASSGVTTDLFGAVVKCDATDGGEESRATMLDRTLLLPPHSRFLMSDMRRLQPLLEEAHAVGGFNLIVVDPPWENASAKRSGAYCTLPERKMLPLPVASLTSEVRRVRRQCGFALECVCE
mmetsp:Transcript_29598/g.53002  ORF Transcript_29598/g.53002 Transcript_29598/m.53002 type:complete len:188 (-) Transcript_29598:2518-3081(-)